MRTASSFQSSPIDKRLAKDALVPDRMNKARDFTQRRKVRKDYAEKKKELPQKQGARLNIFVMV